MSNTPSSPAETGSGFAELLPMDDASAAKAHQVQRLPVDDIVCCGAPPPPPADDREKPGYRICSFVESFLQTPAGAVPVVRTRAGLRDRFGTAGARAGIIRDHYRVAPGLYAAGDPDGDAPVLVTANYKMSFDALRYSLKGADAWILVLDTRGINVWCAAGKNLFSTEELVNRVRTTGVERVVRHRDLILPQLSATGVSARRIKKEIGFRVFWGPVRAGDVQAFLDAGRHATDEMREATFTAGERIMLIPVEIRHAVRPGAIALIAAILISGVGPDIFSPSAAWHRGWALFSSILTGVAAGAVLVPALLPWMPYRSFSAKGLVAGAPAGLAALAWSYPGSALAALAMVTITAAVSSFAAMNFTGATPFTSPSGVEKEMRRAIPFQALAAAAGIFLWVGSAFAR